MKSVILFTSLIAIVVSKECIYDDSGLCMAECPPGTVSYSPACGTDVYTQRTCAQPTPQPMGKICDYSRCDCVGGLLWDAARSACVTHEQCSEAEPSDEPCDDRV